MLFSGSGNATIAVFTKNRTILCTPRLASERRGKGRVFLMPNSRFGPIAKSVG